MKKVTKAKPVAKKAAAPAPKKALKKKVEPKPAAKAEKKMKDIMAKAKQSYQKYAGKPKVEAPKAPEPDEELVEVLEGVKEDEFGNFQLDREVQEQDEVVEGLVTVEAIEDMTLAYEAVVDAAVAAFAEGKTIYNMMGGIYEMDREVGDKLKAAVKALEAK